MIAPLDFLASTALKGSSRNRRWHNSKGGELIKKKQFDEEGAIYANEVTES